MLCNTNLIDLMHKLRLNYQFIYKSNPGNAGDSAIAASTYDFFKKNSINYKFWNNNNHYDIASSIAIYAGGGNLIEKLYSDCANFIEKNSKHFAKIILFPATIRGYKDLLLRHKAKLIVCCREQKSFDYLRNLDFTVNENVFLTHDMAFTLNIDDYVQLKPPLFDTVSCFRTDDESLKKLVPPNNHDISLSWNGDFWDNRDLAHFSTASLISFLQRYKSLDTDRLHIAILGSLIGMNVRFYPNSYYKNEAVFDHSICNQFPNTIFIK
ncbi:hypothetical protein COMNV_01094 [Commensalibacter sp. Nvir]|uniref:polysaccharide pyruvyl transferase family protein n=1 Tax=Commensalibacter sp. Nvir TaxID=3069817 RepID=UPI002D5C4D01|nr:hypothetical protein COMNV_01094 [Commensalibacter sp. Nvir]